MADTSNKSPGGKYQKDVKSKLVLIEEQGERDKAEFLALEPHLRKPKQSRRERIKERSTICLIT